MGAAVSSALPPIIASERFGGPLRPGMVAQALPAVSDPARAFLVLVMVDLVLVVAFELLLALLPELLLPLDVAALVRLDRVPVVVSALVF